VADPWSCSYDDDGSARYDDASDDAAQPTVRSGSDDGATSQKPDACALPLLSYQLELVQRVCDDESRQLSLQRRSENEKCSYASLWGCAAVLSFSPFPAFPSWNQPNN
jgi:hypothetical protein